MTEEAHKSKKEPKEEVVDTLNEAEEKRQEFMRNHRTQRKVLITSWKVLSTSFKSAQYFSKSFMHYLKKCSALLRRRIKKSYKGLNTFIFNLLEGKSVQPIWALLSSFIEVSCTSSKSAQHFSVEEIRIHIKGWALLLSIYWNEKVLSPFSYFFLLLLRSAEKCSALLWCVK